MPCGVIYLIKVRMFRHFYFSPCFFIPNRCCLSFIGNGFRSKDTKIIIHSGPVYTQPIARLKKVKDPPPGGSFNIHLIQTKLSANILHSGSYLDFRRLRSPEAES